MTITPKQAHVLANINRVVPLDDKVGPGSTQPRYQLDAAECTAEISGLAVLKLIGKHSSGGFRRLGAARARNARVGERQAPPASALEAIKASLSAPEAIRTIGLGKR